MNSAVVIEGLDQSAAVSAEIPLSASGRRQIHVRAPELGHLDQPTVPAARRRSEHRELVAGVT